MRPDCQCCKCQLKTSEDFAEAALLDMYSAEKLDQILYYHNESVYEDLRKISKQIKLAIQAERDRAKGLLEACKPFVNAYNLNDRAIDENPAFQDFLDKNRVTPSMTIGDFRRLSQALAQYNGTEEGT